MCIGITKLSNGAGWNMNGSLNAVRKLSRRLHWYQSPSLTILGAANREAPKKRASAADYGREGDLSSKLDVTQRNQDNNDRRNDVDGGHGRHPEKWWTPTEDAEGKHSTP